MIIRYGIIPHSFENIVLVMAIIIVLLELYRDLRRLWLCNPRKWHSQYHCSGSSPADSFNGWFDEAEFLPPLWRSAMRRSALSSGLRTAYGRWYIDQFPGGFIPDQVDQPGAAYRRIRQGQETLVWREQWASTRRGAVQRCRLELITREIDACVQQRRSLSRR